MEKEKIFQMIGRIERIRELVNKEFSFPFDNMEAKEIVELLDQIDKLECEIKEMII
jgi:hypothetical protein